MKLKPFRPPVLLLAAFAAATLSLSVQAETYRVTQNLDGAVVTSLSANGRAAAGQWSADYQTFRWTPRAGVALLGRGTLVPLGHMSGIPRISADGSVVSATILSDDGSYSTAGRWTTSGWSMLAPPLPAGGGMMDGEDCSAFSMSGDGAVIGGLFWRPGQSGGSAHGMGWSAATAMLDMGSSGYASRIDGASADGRVLTGWDEHPSYGNRRAAVWVDGRMTVLEDSDWPSEASAVTPDGLTVVGQSGNPADFQTYATMWQWNGSAWNKTLLGVINKRGSTGFAYATGVSADGSVVVGGFRPDVQAPQAQGFIWTAASGFVEAASYLKSHGARLPAGQKITGVQAISSDGSTLAVATQTTTPPYTYGSLIIHRKP
jgi:uncharacterized membrane protein